MKAAYLNSPLSLLASDNSKRAFFIKSKEIILLKKAVWLYFLLIIFEGALRKWFLVSLAGPLILIRDPIALWIIIKSIRLKLFPSIWYVQLIVVIGSISIFAALFLGHGSLPVALYGARILLLHFPLIFAIGRIFNRRDVLEMGKVVLWLSIPMTLLIGLQFYSPQSAMVNRGLGGVIDKGFQGALGHFRPPGTFSFITGTYLFYGLVACFIFYHWFNKGQINKILLISATIALLIAIPLSISRTLFFEVCLTLGFSFIAVARKPKHLSKMFLILIVAFVAVIFLSKTSFFQHATETFFARFTDATESEGGVKGVIGDRFLGGLISAVMGSLELPFFGYGIGMGTNVGAQLISGGRTFLLHEEEWGRIIDEVGALFGLTIIFIRLSLTAKITVLSYAKMRKGDMLPWMLLSLAFVHIAQGNWSQPTSLGFCTLLAGLVIASLSTVNRQNIKPRVDRL